MDSQPYFQHIELESSQRSDNSDITPAGNLKNILINNQTSKDEDQQQQMQIQMQGSQASSISQGMREEQEKAEKGLKTPSGQLVRAYSKDPKKMNSQELYDPMYFPMQPNSRKTQVMNCQYCHSLVWTEVRYEKGCGTTQCSFALFFTTIILAWVPYCNKRCKDANHYCPRCGALIGQIKY